MAALPHVTVCIPVWNGARFVAETLASVARQTYPNLHVVISDDASTDGSAELCGSIAEQHGFELIVQPERLGWVANCNFLLERAAGDFVCILPHDDILDERYIEVLAAYLSATPVCAMAFCDIRAFGSRNEVQTQTSLVGSPFDRLYRHLTQHLDGTPFRGLVRREVLDRAGGLPANDFGGFAADVVWLAHLALEGEIHRVPEVLYSKRYHQGSTHAAWFHWDEEMKFAAWTDHCARLLKIALQLNLSAAEQWLIVDAAVRLLILADEKGGPYPEVRRLPLIRKAEMVSALLEKSGSDFFPEASASDRRTAFATLIVEAVTAPTAPVTDPVVPRTPGNLLRFLRRKPLKLSIRRPGK